MELSILYCLCNSIFSRHFSLYYLITYVAVCGEAISCGCWQVELWVSRTIGAEASIWFLTYKNHWSSLKQKGNRSFPLSYCQETGNCFLIIWKQWRSERIETKMLLSQFTTGEKNSQRSWYDPVNLLTYIKEVRGDDWRAHPNLMSGTSAVIAAPTLLCPPPNLSTSTYDRLAKTITCI